MANRDPLLRPQRVLDVGSQIGQYELLELLGRGAGGLVYRAFDCHLERQVAIKLLRTSDPEAARRLLQEARSQAQVDHENVCRVYEAGQIDGQAFIAMQFIAGRPLDEVAVEMSLTEKIETVRRISEALHAAHLKKLIHRDIKPSNILVERGPEGEWKPYILDFGIARKLAARGETTTGEVKGTPSYMPPEQVTGRVEDLDARADIYGLGVTLYESLAGQPLYPEASGLSVLAKVLNEEPERLRKVAPGIPIDLESVVMRCLEKDRARRYETALTLAEDLRRFLDGEPVVARGYTLATHLRRTWRRRRLLWVSLALVAAVAAVSILGVAYFQAQRERQWLEAFRQEVRFVEELVRHAYQEPLHDLRPTFDKVRQRLLDLEQRVLTEGGAALGPGHFALGRGYLALRDFERAREHLEIPWELGMRAPEVAYARGRALGALYRKELASALRITDTARREAHLKAIAHTLREPAREALALGSAAEAEPARLVEARIALWEGRFDEALDLARKEAERVPWNYEAIALAAEIQATSGDVSYREGRYGQADALFTAAHTSFLDATRRAPSDPLVLIGRCRLAFARMTLASYALETPLGPHFEDGQAACAAARLADPTQVEPYHLEAALEWRMGEALIPRALDPTEHFQRAREMASQAFQRDQEGVEGFTAYGWASALLAQWQSGHGEDPTHAVSGALAGFDDALVRDSSFAQAYNGIGYTQYILAGWQLEHGEDPTESLAAATAALERAIELDPAYLYAMGTLGDTHVLAARWAWRHGEDPHPPLDAAEARFEQARAVNSRYIWAYTMMADVWIERARIALANGTPPDTALAAGRETLSKVSAISQEGWLDLARGRLETTAGEALGRRGEGPEAAFASSREALDLAAMKLAGETAPHQALAELARAEANWSLAQGAHRALTAQVNRGLESVAKALQINPTLTEVVALEGVLRLLNAQTLQGQARWKEEEAGRARLEAALAANPAHTRAYGNLTGFNPR